MVKGGGGITETFEAFLTQAVLVFSHTDGYSFHPLKVCVCGGGGGLNLLPCLRGGGTDGFRPAIFPF